MVQHTVYPLPPLMLSEIIDDCREHYMCRVPPVPPEYADDEFWLCERNCQWHRDIEPFIVSIEEGHGRHEHDSIEDVSGCQYRWEDYQDEHGRWTERRALKLEYAPGKRCMRDADDSDWIVTLQYRSSGAQAMYGVRRHGDVQHFCVWQD